MPLALGVATYCHLYDYQLEVALERLATLGFKQLEVMTCPPHIWPRGLDRKTREALRRHIDSLGLEVVSTQPTYLDLNLASLNPAIREETVRQMKENIRLTHDLGGKIVVVVPGKRNALIPAPMEMAWELARDSVSACVEDAERFGVTLAVENVAWAFVDTAEQVVRMVEEINSPIVKAAIDVANANMVESPVEALERAKNHLVHVHLSDNRGQDWTHSPIGEGDIDFAGVADRLKEIQFAGVSILEIMIREDVDKKLLDSKASLEQLSWRA